MSPEQVQGLGVDGRSDQFSLAVIAYEILTGERPFVGEHLSTIVYKIVAEEPAAANRINGTLTPQIDEVLRKGLSKKPGDRFPNCSNFVGALELASAESRGCTTLPAGAAAAMPTIAVDDSAILPAAAEPLTEAARTERDRSESPRRSLLLPALMSVAVVLGLAAVVLYQLGGLPGQTTEPIQHARAQLAESQPAESQASEAQPTGALPTGALPTGARPRPVIPPPAGPQKEEAPPAQTVPDKIVAGAVPHEEAPPSKLRSRPAISQNRSQDIRVTSFPLGAKAVLDDNLAQSCRTPCMLHSLAGRHRLTISQAGYQNEYREIHAGETAIDVPMISVRQPMGTLWLSTTPSHATVLINGRAIPQLTPAQIALPPGSYTVTVEKNGQTRTERVELHDSLVLQLALGQ